ncbi:nitronate monooxygenase [Fluviicola sp.]|jgi:nitronate monooxygenase|uniref:NAD(P)H-dependent flavin oxidoreductase n=1 Tax=Fluviicola sp. TaxID=1917219 RepID=UPI0028289231|nr:nitronate monooxygenase [Fluviicola sp.]MDR0802499.1 nitronate monooxygenase [Fluviicola sp.]
MTIEALKNRVALPVIVSPMFLVSGSKLVIECCKSGIVGTLPSLNGRSSEDFEWMLIEITDALKAFEKETNIKPAPFGVNLIVNKTNSRLMPDLDLCIKYQIPLVITSLGAVKEVVDAVHNYGGLVFHDVIKKRHAEKAVESGVDGIIAVANGAGGHAGTANPFALVEEIRSFYPGTLILAGAITTGKDILAAENMGADFAYMGTRFIATEESMAQPAYKEMLLTSHIDDIIYTDGISGVNANFLIPSIEKSGIDISEKKEENFSKLSAEHSKAWKDIWSAGQGTTGIEKIEPVAGLVDSLKKEYKAALVENQEKLLNLKY